MQTKLYKGDCLELMKDIPDKSIDLILCDLPYGTTQNRWDTIIPLDLLWKQYSRVIKEQGAVLLFAQTPFDKVLGCSNLKWLKYEWVWEKEAGTGFLNSKKMPLKIHENILVFYKRAPTYNPIMRFGAKPYRGKVSAKNLSSSNYGESNNSTTTDVYYEGRFPISILKFGRDKGGLHPTQKPVALLEYLIKTYTNEGDIVLDNCMGSGSTGVACVNTGRNFIGIELDENYFTTAEQRISQAKRDIFLGETVG